MHKEIIIVTTIHLIIPIIGVLLYYYLIKKMNNEKVKNAPKSELFIIFFTYGIVLVIALTTFFWKWSGMTSIGLLYLFAAPIILGLIVIKQYKNRNLSQYHEWTYYLALLYM